jgi:hypothetical protein
MRRFAWSVVLAACGGGSSASPDAAPVAIDSAPADAAPPMKCGAGPYVTFSGAVLERKLDGTTPVLADATVHVVECGASVTTDATGHFSIPVTPQSPMTVEWSKAGYITLIGEQLELASNDTDTSGLRKTADWGTAPYMPGYDATHGYMIIGVGFENTAQAPCNTVDGVAITLPNHPEATVHYLDTSNPPMEDTNLTATGVSGIAYVSGITPGALTSSDLVFTKSTCTYGYPGGTGNFTVAAGAMTRVLPFAQ